jgi:hypothetical protein
VPCIKINQDVNLISYRYGFNGMEKMMKSRVIIPFPVCWSSAGLPVVESFDQQLIEKLK